MKKFLMFPALCLGLAACDTTSSMNASLSSGTTTPRMAGGVAYELTLTPMWSAKSHPVDYPSSSLFSAPHFSGLIGTCHGQDYALFAEGSLPTPGLERLSEEGKHTPLDAEIRAAVAAGKAGEPFASGPVKDLSKPITITVPVSERFPMLSTVAMIAPSPDWFLGANSIDLREGDGWVARKEVLLFAYDSGGDEGTSYTASDADANPKHPTRLNDAAPFQENDRRLPVAKLTLRRL